MGVIMGVGIEIAFGPVNRDFLHQPRIAKSAQGVVDGCQRHGIALPLGRVKQAFGGDMAVLTVAHQQMRQRHALPRGTQARLGKPLRTDLLCCLGHWL